jgi:hypothetical protein
MAVPRTAVVPVSRNKEYGTIRYMNANINRFADDYFISPPPSHLTYRAVERAGHDEAKLTLDQFNADPKNANSTYASYEKKFTERAELSGVIQEISDAHTRWRKALLYAETEGAPESEGDRLLDAYPLVRAIHGDRASEYIWRISPDPFRMLAAVSIYSSLFEMSGVLKCGHNTIEVIRHMDLAMYKVLSGVLGDSGLLRGTPYNRTLVSRVLASMLTATHVHDFRFSASDKTGGTSMAEGMMGEGLTARFDFHVKRTAEFSRKIHRAGYFSELVGRDLYALDAPVEDLRAMADYGSRVGVVCRRLDIGLWKVEHIRVDTNDAVGAMVRLTRNLDALDVMAARKRPDAVDPESEVIGNILSDAGSLGISVGVIRDRYLEITRKHGEEDTGVSVYENVLSPYFMALVDKIRIDIQGAWISDKAGDMRDPALMYTGDENLSRFYDGAAVKALEDLRAAAQAAVRFSPGEVRRLWRPVHADIKTNAVNDVQRLVFEDGPAWDYKYAEDMTMSLIRLRSLAEIAVTSDTIVKIKISELPENSPGKAEAVDALRALDEGAIRKRNQLLEGLRTLFSNDLLEGHKRARRLLIKELGSAARLLTMTKITRKIGEALYELISATINTEAYDQDTPVTALYNYLHAEGVAYDEAPENITEKLVSLRKVLATDKAADDEPPAEVERLVTYLREFVAYTSAFLSGQDETVTENVRAGTYWPALRGAIYRVDILLRKVLRPMLDPAIVYSSITGQSYADSHMFIMEFENLRKALDNYSFKSMDAALWEYLDASEKDAAARTPAEAESVRKIDADLAAPDLLSVAMEATKPDTPAREAATRTHADAVKRRDRRLSEITMGRGRRAVIDACYQKITGFYETFITSKILGKRGADSRLQDCYTDVLEFHREIFGDPRHAPLPVIISTDTSNELYDLANDIRKIHGQRATKEPRDLHQGQGDGGGDSLPQREHEAYRRHGGAHAGDQALENQGPQTEIQDLPREGPRQPSTSCHGAVLQSGRGENGPQGRGGSLRDEEDRSSGGGCFCCRGANGSSPSGDKYR